MKHSSLLTTVVACVFLSTPSIPLWAIEPTPCILQVDILKLVDGSPLVDLVEIMKFKSKINSILTQQITKTCSFKDLVKLEPQLSVNDHAMAVQRFISQFKNTAQPYLQRIHAAREVIKPCIEAWVAQRQQPHSLLRLLNSNEFQPGKEQALFAKHITSLKTLDQFLEDLHLFLADFTASLPKSLAKYRAALTKVTQK